MVLAPTAPNATPLWPVSKGRSLEMESKMYER